MALTATGPSLVALAIVLAGVGVVRGAGDVPSRTAPLTARTAPTSCKPSAPLLISASTRAVSAASVTIDYELTALSDAASIDVEIELVHGGRVLSHAVPASDVLAHGVTRSGSAIIELPEAVRRGEHGGEIRIVATVGMHRADGGLERASSVAAVIVGDAPLPVSAVRVVSGGLVSLDVPARHEGGAR